MKPGACAWIDNDPGESPSGSARDFIKRRCHTSRITGTAVFDRGGENLKKKRKVMRSEIKGSE